MSEMDTTTNSNRNASGQFVKGHTLPSPGRGTKADEAGLAEYKRAVQSVYSKKMTVEEWDGILEKLIHDAKNNRSWKARHSAIDNILKIEKWQGISFESQPASQGIPGATAPLLSAEERLLIILQRASELAPAADQPTVIKTESVRTEGAANV